MKPRTYTALSVLLRTYPRLTTLTLLMLGVVTLSTTAYAGWDCCWTRNDTEISMRGCESPDCPTSEVCYQIKHTRNKSCGFCLKSSQTCTTVWLSGTRWYKSGNCNITGTSGCTCFIKTVSYIPQNGPYVESCT